MVDCPEKHAPVWKGFIVTEQQNHKLDYLPNILMGTSNNWVTAREVSAICSRCFFMTFLVFRLLEDSSLLSEHSSKGFNSHKDTSQK